MADKFPYQKTEEMKTYATTIGAGQTILGAISKMQNYDRENRLLSSQLENQLMQTRLSALERVAERKLKEREIGLEEKKWNTQGKLLEENIRKSKQVELGGGQGLFEFNPDTGQYEKKASMPFNPSGAGSTGEVARWNTLMKIVQGGVDVDPITGGQVQYPGIISYESKVDESGATKLVPNIERTWQNFSASGPMLRRLNFTPQEVESMLQSFGISKTIPTPQLTPEQIAERQRISEAARGKPQGFIGALSDVTREKPYGALTPNPAEARPYIAPVRPKFKVGDTRVVDGVTYTRNEKGQWMEK